MADLITPFLGLTKPIVNDEAGEDLWGDKLNTNFDKLDASAADMAGDITLLQGSSIHEAPVDGKPYGRKDAAWFDVSSIPTSWDAISGKPATFPPELPIPQAGVTGLIADQATQTAAINANVTAINGKEPAIAPGTVNDFWRGDKTWQPLSSMTVDAYTKAQADARFEPIITAGTTAQYWKGNKTWATLDKAAVGLGNVDNTSDASKPVSTAGAAADALRVLKAGDTMTGALQLPPGSLAAPSLNFGVANTGFYGASFVLFGVTNGLRRFTLTSELQMDVPVVLPADPTAALQAATKQYADTKEPAIAVGTTTQYWRGDKTWQTLPTGGGSASVTVAASFPGSPTPGDLCWRSDLGLMFIYYNDGTSAQWVVTTPSTDTAALDTRYKQISDGGLFKVSSGVLASAAANINIAMPAGFTSFELLLGGFAPVTTAQALAVRFSADGTTFLAANYVWGYNATPSTGVNVPAGSASSTFIALHGAMSNASGTRYGGRITFPPALAGVAVPSLLHQGHHYDGTNYNGSNGWGTITVGITGMPLAVQLMTTSGNIQAGATWQLNGYK